METLRKQNSPTGNASSPAFYRDWILAATVAIILASDQITKAIIRANLELGESWPMDGFFRITHGVNTGSAFGLFQGYTTILTVASVAAIGFIIYFYRTQTESNLVTRFTTGLLLGGAIGNLIDRLAAGEVTDFIDIGRWPIFNLADSSIVVGMILLVATLLLAPEPKQQSDTLTATGDTES